MWQNCRLLCMSFGDCLWRSAAILAAVTAIAQVRKNLTRRHERALGAAKQGD